MKRVALTVVACAAFLAMLTGTSRRRTREAGSIPKLAIPATTGWTRTEVAGLRFLVPPSWTVTRADAPAGLRFAFDPTAYMFGPVDLAQVRGAYPPDYLMYVADDAVIALEAVGARDECRAAACSPHGHCLDIRTRDNERCTELVALVRSIEVLP